MEAPSWLGRGGRLYRTGDLLRWRPGGTLEFLGRLDQQVKLRGFRIELEEIEAVLREHSGVVAAAAIVREDAPGDRRLVAYVVSAGGEPASTDELRRHLRGRLPEYMIPSVIVPLEALPVSANGKLDRRGLPRPDSSNRIVESEYRKPTTPLEEVLAAIWGEILQVDRVGVDDDFFNLGGHSLLAVKMTSRVQTELGLELPLNDVFAKPTIRELAVVLAQALAAGAAGDDDLETLLLEAEGVNP